MNKNSFLCMNKIIFFSFILNKYLRLCKGELSVQQWKKPYLTILYLNKQIFISFRCMYRNYIFFCIVYHNQGFCVKEDKRKGENISVHQCKKTLVYNLIFDFAKMIFMSLYMYRKPHRKNHILHLFSFI